MARMSHEACTPQAVEVHKFLIFGNDWYCNRLLAIDKAVKAHVHCKTKKSQKNQMARMNHEAPKKSMSSSWPSVSMGLRTVHLQQPCFFPYFFLTRQTKNILIFYFRRPARTGTKKNKCVVQSVFSATPCNRLILILISQLKEVVNQKTNGDTVLQRINQLREI
jgi:hypothetical protein